MIHCVLQRRLGITALEQPYCQSYTASERTIEDLLVARLNHRLAQS